MTVRLASSSRPRALAYSVRFAARPPRGLFSHGPLMKTYVAKPSDRERDWYVVDA